MTKRELMTLLEPFSDDVRIYRFGQAHRDGEAMFEDAMACARVADADHGAVSQPRLSTGEIFILID